MSDAADLAQHLKLSEICLVHPANLEDAVGADVDAISLGLASASVNDRMKLR